MNKAQLEQQVMAVIGQGDASTVDVVAKRFGQLCKILAEYFADTSCDPVGYGATTLPDGLIIGWRISRRGYDSVVQTRDHVTVDYMQRYAAIHGYSDELVISEVLMTREQWEEFEQSQLAEWEGW